MNVQGVAGARERAAELVRTALVWDGHAGFAYERASDLTGLSRWKKSGVDLVSVNIGYDAQGWASAVEGVSRYRHFIRAHPEDFVQVETVTDIDRARRQNKLAVSFDIEGANALNGDSGMVDFYYRLGVRQLLFVYNRTNLVGGGCHDANVGFSAFGREVLREMNRVGMLVDCSHCSLRTSLEAMEHSHSPPIFSHSNARALCDHERNITDEQIKRCAERRGVIGVTGCGPFLGPRGADPQHMVEHMDYMCQLVGPAHVGIGIDSVLVRESPRDYANSMGPLAPYYWPDRQYSAGLHFGVVRPEDLTAVVDGLIGYGYRDADIHAMLGGNFRRVAESVWKPVGADRSTA